MSNLTMHQSYDNINIHSGRKQMLTVSKVINIFKDLNAKHFDNKLPLIPMFVSNRCKSTLGCFQYSWRRVNGERVLTGKHFITIANVPVHQIERNLVHTVMHEMCHYKLFLTYSAFVPGKQLTRYTGHTPEFNRMMRSFGYADGRKHPLYGNKEVSPSDFFKNIPPVLLRPMVIPSAPVVAPSLAMHYKVLSNGKIGTFVRESMVYGKKHISLQIEGMMFPFTTAMDNVQPLTIAA